MKIKIDTGYLANYSKENEFIGMMACYSGENLYLYWFEQDHNIWYHVERIINESDAISRLAENDIYTVIEF